MCAVPIKGLHKSQLTQKQLYQMQGLIKDHIPTGDNTPEQEALSDQSGHPSENSQGSVCAGKCDILSSHQGTGMVSGDPMKESVDSGSHASGFQCAYIYLQIKVGLHGRALAAKIGS
jgi:hypothetical protein